MNSTTEELIRELEAAERFVRDRNRAQWAEALRLYQQFMRQEEFDRLKYLWRVFAPTCAWDDLTATFPKANHAEANAIGERVFNAVERRRVELGMEPHNWTFGDERTSKLKNARNG